MKGIGEGVLMSEYGTSEYGTCKCGAPLVPVWFRECEYIKGIPTGRTRLAVSHLECPECLTNVVIDDSFDEPWE